MSLVIVALVHQVVVLAPDGKGKYKQIGKVPVHPSDTIGQVRRKIADRLHSKGPNLDTIYVNHDDVVLNDSVEVAKMEMERGAKSKGVNRRILEYREAQ